jgi:hypothetical protein
MVFSYLEWPVKSTYASTQRLFWVRLLVLGLEIRRFKAE